MDMVLVGLQGEQCLVYLDDVIVFGSTYDLHLERLERVFERLQKIKAGLKLRPEKCFFAHSSVRYLGYLVSSKGLGLLTDHVEPVVKFPVPYIQRTGCEEIFGDGKLLQKIHSLICTGHSAIVRAPEERR